MTKVKTLKGFQYQVLQLARQKDAKLFHCYCHGDIFQIATVKKVMDFDFSDYKKEEKVVDFMLIAIAILKKHLRRPKLLYVDAEGEKRFD